MAHVIKSDAVDATGRRVRSLGGARRRAVVRRWEPGPSVAHPNTEAGSREHAVVDGSEGRHPGDAFVALAETNGPPGSVLHRHSLPPAPPESGAARMDRGEFSAEAERLRRVVQRVVERLLGERQNMVRAAHSQIVDLAIAIAQRVVRTTARCDHGVAQRVVVEALQQVQDREQVRVRLSPEDLEHLRKTDVETQAGLATVAGLQLVEDADIEPGGCIVESDMGAIDARIDTQLHQIEEALSRALETGRVDGPADEPVGGWGAS